MTPAPMTDSKLKWLWSEAHNDGTERMPAEVFAKSIIAARDIQWAEMLNGQEPVAEVVEDHFSRQVKGIGGWHKVPNGTKLYTHLAPAQKQEPKITGAALRKLHDEMEPLATMENEEQVSSWWKHFAGKVRLALKELPTNAPNHTALLRQALEALEYADACLSNQLSTRTKHEYSIDWCKEIGAAIKEALG